MCDEMQCDGGNRETKVRGYDIMNTFAQEEYITNMTPRTAASQKVILLLILKY